MGHRWPCGQGICAEELAGPKFPMVAFRQPEALVTPNDGWKVPAGHATATVELSGQKPPGGQLRHWADLLAPVFG